MTSSTQLGVSTFYNPRTRIWSLPTLSLQVLRRKIQDKYELFKINSDSNFENYPHHYLSLELTSKEDCNVDT